MGQLTILSTRIARRGILGRRTTGRVGGDIAVLASMRRGLSRAGVSFDWNPHRPTPTVVVQSDVDALRQALEWKREGRIRRLLAGPNLVTWSTDYDGIIGDPGVDVCLVPSTWVEVAYIEDNPSLTGRIRVWAAGVDERWWRPRRAAAARRGRVMLYVKVEAPEFVTEVRELLAARGLDVETVVYGRYEPRAYRALLDRAAVAIFLSRSESQGLALAEAWAMGVPTLAWDPGELVYNGRVYSEVSAAPYLSRSTGRTWRTTAELTDLLGSAGDFGFSPRSWVLENMTDVVATRRLLEIAHVDGGAD